MNSWTLLLATVLLLAAPAVQATVLPSTHKACTLGGKPGIKECVKGHFTPCEVESEGEPPPLTGTVRPKFQVLTVIYAPPGTQGGSSSSSVSYGSGSSFGSKVSSTNAFKDGRKVTASVKGGVLGTGTEVSANFSYSNTAESSQTIEISKSATTEVNVPGPSVDGVDHDRDQIWLWLNPSLDVSLTPKTVQWTVSSQPRADIQFAFVGHLKDPTKMPPGLAQTLLAHGITPADYPTILKADPFAGGATAIDTRRFKSLNQTFPYNPPFSATDPATTMKFTSAFTTSSASSQSASSEYSVGVSVQGDAGFASLFETSVKLESSWTWTHTNAAAATASRTESASVSVGGPSFGYAGPTDMAVYYDSVWKTFMFAPIASSVFPSMRGTVRSLAGAAQAGREVVVVTNGATYRTVTAANGQYRVFGKLVGPIQVRVGSVRKQLARVPAATSRVDIQVR
jgi:hypothetical protein